MYTKHYPVAMEMVAKDMPGFCLSYRGRRTPRTDAPKPYRCDEPGCGKAFYYSRDMLRHKTHKHGRVPTKSRRGQFQYILSGIDYSEPSASKDLPASRTEATASRDTGGAIEMGKDSFEDGTALSSNLDESRTEHSYVKQEPDPEPNLEADPDELSLPFD